MTSYNLDTAAWTEQPRAVRTTGGRFGPITVGDAARDMIVDVAADQANGVDVQVWALVPLVAVDDRPIDPPPTATIDQAVGDVLEQGPGAFLEVVDDAR